MQNTTITIRLSSPIQNLKNSKREYHFCLWMSTLEVLKVKSQKGQWSSRVTLQKTQLGSFASDTTSMKRLKRDQSSFFSSRLLLSLLRYRKKMTERVTTTLLAQITITTTMKMKMRMIISLAQARVANGKRMMNKELVSITTTQIINFLNDNFTPINIKFETRNPDFEYLHPKGLKVFGQTTLDRKV